MNPNLTVVIPTCKRPLFLRTALSSVQRQTARAQITEVVVIENGGARDSEEICREFAGLPIRYVFRDPPLAPEKSMRPLFQELRDGFVALLFDDDWWDPRHLECARGAFERYPDTSAYFSAEYSTTGESKPLTTGGNWVHWFAVQGRDEEGIHVFSFADAVVASLLITPGHFSTLVTTKEMWGRCLGIADIQNPFDTDRLLFVEFAKHGSVIFNTRPNAYVRVHPGQEQRRLGLSGECRRWWLDSTRRIMQAAHERGIDVKQLYADRIALIENAVPSLMSRNYLGSVDALAGGGWLPEDLTQSIRWHHRTETLRRWIPLVLWDRCFAMMESRRRRRR